MTSTITTVTMTPPAAFDYNEFDSDTAMKLLQQAELIRARLRKHTEDIIETGRDLLAVKDKIDHGLFVRWIEIELKIAPRTAKAFMSAARMADETKSAMVALLPPATVYRLAAKSTPPEIRNQVLDRVARGDVPSDAEVAGIIKADERSRLIAKREAERKEETATQRQRRQRRAKERALAEERRAQEQEREEQAKAKIGVLVNKLVSAVPRDLVRETFAAVELLFKEHSCAVFWLERALRESLREYAQRSNDEQHPLDIPSELRRAAP